MDQGSIFFFLIGVPFLSKKRPQNLTYKGYFWWKNNKLFLICSLESTLITSTQLLLMKINLWTHKNCLTCRQSQHTRTHSHKCARPKRVWTKYTAVHCSDIWFCQSHEFALDAVWLWASIHKFISSNNECTYSPSKLILPRLLCQIWEQIILALDCIDHAMEAETKIITNSISSNSQSLFANVLCKVSNYEYLNK